jgi:hypothetical protein
VVTVDKGGKYFESAPKQISYQYKLHLRLTPAGKGRATLSWDLPPFYKNTRSMVVNLVEGSSQTKLADNIPPSQTSVEINFPTPFGELKELWVSIQADAEGESSLPYDRYTIAESITLGIRTPPSFNITYNQKEDSYYLVNTNISTADYSAGIFRLDHNLRITDSLTTLTSGTLLTSPDGNKVFFARQGSIVELENSPLRIKQSYNFNIYGAQALSLANNNYIHYQANNNVYILDLTTGNILFSAAKGSASHLSPDGQYLINGGDLYKFNGTTFQVVSVLPYSDIRYVHFPPAGDRLFLATANKAIVYDHVNKSTIREFAFSTEEPNRSGFNDFNSTYYTRGTGLTLLNIGTGEIKVVSASQTNNVTMEGQYLFSYSGFGLNPY